VARSVKGKQLRVLEIGSLFGIGLSMIYDAVRGQFDDIHVTAMDPLSGFYSVGTLDTLLKIPVCKEIFWHNMRIADIPQEHLTLIDKLSTAPEAHEEAARKRYDLLVIDGDHSYEGVKFDYDNYIGLVEDGGYIVIDDYGSKAWPDVTRFVDTVVKGDTRVELVGTDWTTAVFRVRPRGIAA
jgi:cephalosporin hydroxylase